MLHLSPWRILVCVGYCEAGFCLHLELVTAVYTTVGLTCSNSTYNHLVSLKWRAAMAVSTFNVVLISQWCRYTNLEWRGNVIQGLDGDFFVHPPYKSNDVKGNTEDAVARIKKVVSFLITLNIKFSTWLIKCICWKFEKRIDNRPTMAYVQILGASYSLIALIICKHVVSKRLMASLWCQFSVEITWAYGR